MMQNSRKAEPSEKIHRYALLCIAAVYVATCKLSAGCLVVLVLYPLIWFIKEKKWREIAAYLFCGIAVLVPWLIRNVIISGWLLYPFTSLDLFNVDWKVPAELVIHDADQIKVWGRCLYDVTKIDEPISVWLPVWWSEKQRSEMMLLLGNGLAVAGFLLGGLCVLIRNRCCSKKIDGGEKFERPADADPSNRNMRCFTPGAGAPAAAFGKTAFADSASARDKDGTAGNQRTCQLPMDKVMLYLAILICLAGWFLTAPFIRYGLAFLLLLPCMVVSEWIRPLRMGPVRIVSGFGCIAIFLCMSMFWDYYVLFDLVWVKQNVLSDHYLLQQDYDRPETYPYEIEGGLTVYIPQEGDNISYYAFPGDAYQSMAERAQLRGTDIRDGFRTKID